MDPDPLARMYTYARRYQSRSDASYHGEEYNQEGDEELRSEFLCPFCADEFDVVGLCCHFDEEHAREASAGVCPVCAKKVGSDLVRHLTMQHANLLKVQRRRRLRKGGLNFTFSMLKKELGEGKLQSLLAGSSFSVPSSRDKPDPLLTSFMHNPHVLDGPPRVLPLSSIGASSMAESTLIGPTNGSDISYEDQKEKSRKCEFLQGLLLSTFLDENCWKSGNSTEPNEV